MARKPKEPSVTTRLLFSTVSFFAAKMRTRSQPISPSGFQSLETASLKKKAPSAATSKKDKPKKEATRVSKGRPKKASSKKTASQKLALEKEAQAADNNVVEATPAHVPPAVPSPVPGSSPPVPSHPGPPVETTAQGQSEHGISSYFTPISRLHRRILQPRLQRFSGILSSPDEIYSSPTREAMERAARRAQNSAAAELILEHSPGGIDASKEECAPRCPCCSEVLQCPSGHSVWTNAGFRLMKRKKSLTTTSGESRKRQRESAAENDDEHEQERPSKRSQHNKSDRSAKNPVVELHRRRRVTPYSERQRRRRVESEGRIDKTVFRIPELIAQNKADEEAALQAKADDDSESEDDAELQPVVPFVRAADTPSRPRASRNRRQTPGPPTTPRRGWNIGNLLNSVPRSISKLLPFGEREDEEEADPSINTTPTPTLTATPTPSSARVPVTAAVTAASPSPQQEQTASHENATTSAPSPDLSYSLYPKPMSWSPLNRSKPLAKENQNGAAADPATSKADTPEPSVPSKKRKYKGIPDRIPNPPGVSYGMHPDYFNSDTDSDIDDEFYVEQPSQAEQPKPSSSIKPNPPGNFPQPLTQAAVTETKAKEPKGDTTVPQTPFRGILRMRKRVRFGPSPQDVPSKSRFRRFDNIHQDTPIRPSAARTPVSPAQHNGSMPGSYMESPPDVVMTTPSPIQTSPSGRPPLAEKQNEETVSTDSDTGGWRDFDHDRLYDDDFFDNIPEDQIKGIKPGDEYILDEIREGKERRRREKAEALQAQKLQLSDVAKGKQPVENTPSRNETPVPSVPQTPTASTSQMPQFDGPRFTPYEDENVPTSPPKTPSGRDYGERTNPGLGSIVARRAISRSRSGSGAPGVARPTRSLASLAPPSSYPARVGGAAVEKLRAELNTFRPKLPSALQIAERLASSPLAAPSPPARLTGAGAPNSSRFGWPAATPVAYPAAGQPSYERLREEFRRVLRSR